MRRLLELFYLIVVCPRLRVVNVTACRGHCYSGSVRFLSPLGSMCVITCAGNHDNGPPAQQHNLTCVWENGKAVWQPRYLPEELTQGIEFFAKSHTRPPVSLQATCVCNMMMADNMVAAARTGPRFSPGWRRQPGRPHHSWIQQIGDGTPFSIRAEWSNARRRGHSGLTQRTSAVYVI